MGSVNVWAIVVGCYAAWGAFFAYFGSAKKEDGTNVSRWVLFFAWPLICAIVLGWWIKGSVRFRIRRDR